MVDLFACSLIHLAFQELRAMSLCEVKEFMLRNDLSNSYNYNINNDETIIKTHTI
jgi:hypothetical protein